MSGRGESTSKKILVRTLTLVLKIKIIIIKGLTPFALRSLS